jgi:hypothetical protein
MALPPSLSESSESNRDRRKFLLGALRVGLALVLATFICQIKLEYVESFLYDLRVRIRPAPAVSENVQLILIDPSTVERLRASPGYAQHAQLLNRLADVNPRAVIYDLAIEALEGNEQDKAEFLKAAERLPQLTILTDRLQMKGEEAKLQMAYPFDRLRLASGPKSSDTNNFAKDGVTRRFLIEYQGSRTLHVELAQQINPEVRDNNLIRGLFNFLGTDQAYINFRPPRTYPTASFADIVQGTQDLSAFRDRIVILGQDTQVSERDYALTPYSRELVTMTSAEVHANILDTLIRNDSPRRSPPWLNLILVSIISIITVWVVFAIKPTQGLMILGGTLGAFAVFSGLAFWPFGFWVPMAHPLLAMFLCYYFFIPYRLIIENRRSWEIYQKHQLLQQLEELKTNFISMMSHDLKTPIARILGMTDIIQKDPSPLSNPQREALDTIRASSDDLLKFINSILQYGRIEAQQVELQLQSKDINALLTDVIKKHEFLAKLKRIQIVPELETLFPIPIDPDLVKQILSNLIENAIKYSPEETKVLVSTEEKNGWVVIQVADQGAGIPADEVSNIFMKFFRSKNAKSSPIKGSGLGLYLAKYFTELHGGRISVESSYGQGSTFTVELPLQSRGNHA